MRYSAHLDTLYGHLPPHHRPHRAADHGFACVELWAPRQQERPGIAQALRDRALEVACVNTHQGPCHDDFGQLGNPAATAWWREDFRQTLDYARTIGARAINVLAGGRLAEAARDRQLRTAGDNLTWALEQLTDPDPVLLLEPLNSADRRSPLLRGVSDALHLITHLGDPPKLRVLFDAYHLYQEESDLISALRTAAPRIGHIQVADWPGRGAPGTGRIPFPALLAAIDRLGYDGWIGLEYLPAGTGRVPTTPALLAALGSPTEGRSS
jgi:hydroxypyruvate isomerase